MAKMIDSLYYKITADNSGKVWAVDGNGLPKVVCQDVNAYIDDLLDNGSKNKLIRILAAPVNYSLISGFYTAKQEKLVESVQVAGPTLMQKNRPESSLIRMRLCTLPPSLGGWHEMTNDDFIVYTMGTHIEMCKSLSYRFKKDGTPTASTLKKVKEFDTTIGWLMARHSMFKRLSFIDDINPVMLGRLVGSIGDPRWFVDPDRPDRLSRLFSWVGLHGPVKSACKAIRRIEATICWEGTDTYGFRSYNSDPDKLSAKLNDPGCFILKYASDKWGSDFKKWPYEKITKYFIKFLRLSWLDSIYPYPNPWMEPLFDYSQFFKNKNDLDAFKKFIRS